MLVATFADRGAPGSTTTALALAAARGLPAVVVEADPYGGDLALRCLIDDSPLPPTPTVLGLGAGRAEGTSGRGLDLARDGSHRLNETVRIVPGFSGAEQGASVAWPVVATNLTRQLVPVFADLGRIHTGSPSIPIASAADVLVPVCRGDRAALQQLLWRLEQLVPVLADASGRTPVVVPVVIADRRHARALADQTAVVLSRSTVAPTIRGVGSMVWDEVAAEHLRSGGSLTSRTWLKSRMRDSAARVLTLIADSTGIDLTAAGSDASEPPPVERRSTTPLSGVQELLARVSEGGK